MYITQKEYPSNYHKLPVPKMENLTRLQHIISKKHFENYAPISYFAGKKMRQISSTFNE